MSLFRIREQQSTEAHREKFTCFSCGQPGHISPNCPNKSRNDKADIKKDNGKKIVKNSRVSISEEEGLNFVKGRIDNKDIQLLLDYRCSNFCDA